MALGQCAVCETGVGMGVGGAHARGLSATSAPPCMTRRLAASPPRRLPAWQQGTQRRPGRGALAVHHDRLGQVHGEGGRQLAPGVQPPHVAVGLRVQAISEPKQLLGPGYGVG